MSAVVEQHARAHLVTDAPDGHRAIRVALRYDPSAQSPSIHIALPGSPGQAEWDLPRALLEKGLRTPAGSGAVQVWPCGRVQAVIEFHAEGGVTVLQFDCVALMRFLRRTYAVTATTATATTATTATR
ncbi:SsgA family sporulation/cell division regulator [Streptomyces sp. B-S-A8]|uniref:SsgA family sporulation/cell division regulator n=1 Tax=Streptomyces solicavernae TaxID=3043614 RepID=A0ABT6RQ90_9ACTN|nr:SsgA family sporulation/cell division regulator [Streptomyces sp. B-S-A8]MDI3386601.1 SsgA family sporulation/cell division regulator [Streptomyces sp. B-S-A8]